MLNDIISISREAGELIRGGFGTLFEIEYKTNVKNLVTHIDKASEKLIIDFIKKKYPSHSILAEESGEDNRGSEYLWVIDPLDGTTNFAHGLPIFSVSIGLQKNNEIICGVIYDVMQDVMFSSERGSGAYANGKEIRVNENHQLSHSLLVTGFPYNIADNPEGALDKFITITKASRGIRRLGSAAIDLCYVANGIFDGFWEIHLHPWDMCAGMLLIEEAGGEISGFRGEAVDIFTKKILATNGRIHGELMSYLKD
jgi:myo-inositol-1(or 4)-monophosphatase